MFPICFNGELMQWPKTADRKRFSDGIGFPLDWDGNQRLSQEPHYSFQTKREQRKRNPERAQLYAWSKIPIPTRCRPNWT